MQFKVVSRKQEGTIDATLAGLMLAASELFEPARVLHSTMERGWTARARGTYMASTDTLSDFARRSEAGVLMLANNRWSWLNSQKNHYVAFVFTHDPECDSTGTGELAVVIPEDVSMDTLAGWDEQVHLRQCDFPTAFSAWLSRV